MNTYDHWVTETLASNAAHPESRRTPLDTLEFALVQSAIDASTMESPGLSGRLRQLRALVSSAMTRMSASS